MRLDRPQTGTFLHSLPYGIAGFDAELLCELVFGKNDTVAVLLAAGYGAGDFPERRIVDALDRREEVVAVNVEYTAFHKAHLISNISSE